MDVHCVAGDLARLMGEWLEGDSIARAEALAAYERIRPARRRRGGPDRDFAMVTALLIGEHWISWHYVEGRRFDDPSAIPRGIARGLAHLRRLVS